MTRRMLTKLGLTAAILLTLAACGGSQSKNVYRIGILAQPTAGNFWGINAIANYWDLAVQSPMRLSLYGVSDQRFQLIPQAAADFASPLMAEGGTWISTVKLRQGIRWSDGQPLTANDVAFTLNTALRFGLAGGNWSAWADANYLRAVEAPDDLTVKFIYASKPGMARHDWGTLLASIAAEHYWAPRIEEALKGVTGLERPAAGADDAAWEAYQARQAEAAEKLYALDDKDEPVAGAFVFSKEEPGSFIELTANKNYFFAGVAFTGYENGAYQEEKPKGYSFTAFGTPEGTKTFEYKSGPNVSKTVYSVYGDLNAAVLALQSGEIDFLLNPQGLPKGLAESVASDPNLTVVKNKSVGFRFLAFNTRREPMKDDAFRQAVAVLLDREFLTDTILQGVAYPIHSFVPEANAAWYKPGLPSWGYLADGTPMTREERVKKAVEILTAAGYSWSDDTIPVWDAENGVAAASGTLVPARRRGAAVPRTALAFLQLRSAAGHVRDLDRPVAERSRNPRAREAARLQRPDRAHDPGAGFRHVHPRQPGRPLPLLPQRFLEHKGGGQGRAQRRRIFEPRLRPALGPAPDVRILRGVQTDRRPDPGPHRQRRPVDPALRYGNLRSV